LALCDLLKRHGVPGSLDSVQAHLWVTSRPDGLGLDGIGVIRDPETPEEYLSDVEHWFQRQARLVYDERLTFGVAKEQARKDLPLSTYTQYIWKMDLHNLFHYLGLRLDSHAQLEIRSYANAIASIVGKGTLLITLAHDPILKMVRLEITDSGTGITDEDKIRLFEPNFSTKKTGMGLGLTIVSTIISDHNGMIRVQDNHPRGAKFIIELPE